MEFTRIILSTIMALLVSIPMCVCGNVLASPEINQAPLSNCCSQDHSHSEESPVEDRNGCGDDCDPSNHEQAQYLPSEQKVSIPASSGDSQVTASTYFTLPSSLVFLSPANSFRAPPQCLEESLYDVLIMHAVFRI